MSYIGRGLQAGAFRQLDDISSGFDGSDATHTMQVNSADVTVGDVNQILLSLGGVVQNPGTDFTVSGSVLTFTTAPAANTSFFAILLGSDNGGTVTPTDLSVSTGKIAADAITSAKIADDAVTGDHIASSGAFAIGAAGTTSSIAGVNVLFEANSIFIGDDVSGTTDTAANSVGVGVDALDAVTTGDANVALGKSTLSGNTTGGNNIAIGNQALNAPDTESNNLAIGSNALNGAVAGGEFNVAIGNSSLAALTSADMNTAVGYQAGSAVTTGDGNVLVGHQAGLAVTGAGAYNVCLGTAAGTAITTGIRNTMIGQAGYNFDAENDNLGIGHAALGGAINGGEFNVVVGNYSGDAITTGDGNQLLGYTTGSAITTGYDNTYLGRVSGSSNANSVGVDTTTGYRNTLIGTYMNTAAADTAHAIGIGYAMAVAANDFSFGKPSNVVTNDFDADANWSRSSDVRKKQNIYDQGLGLDFINDLRTVRFQWKPSNEFPKEWNDYSEENNMDTDVIMHGFIAQEVKGSLDKHATDSDKNFSGWKEGDDGMQHTSREMFVIPLIKAVQELSATVTTLQQEINTLKGK